MLYRGLYATPWSPFFLLLEARHGLPRLLGLYTGEKIVTNSLARSQDLLSQVHITTRPTEPVATSVFDRPLAAVGAR